jgi:isopentenyl-diphosphate delta-isomerase
MNITLRPKRMNSKVVLVNPDDTVIGEYDKIKAHKEGLLHRAFSVFIFNRDGMLYLQQRASNKYHSANLWTNTCCSHPCLNADVEKNAIQRLNEEMGLRIDKLFLVDKVLYYVELENGFKEHEVDYLFLGFSNDLPRINKKEVKNWKKSSLNEVIDDVKANPNQYTFWFKLFLPKFEQLNLSEYAY